MLSLLRKPWLHFVVLGSCLFILDRTYYPEPKPTIGPPNAERVMLQEQALSMLQTADLSAVQRRAIQDRELRDELLFIEALDRGLIERDTVVQRRLIRNMRFLDPTTEKTDQDLLSEAYDMRLHLADEVIRRRTVQLMETLIAAGARIPVPTDPELATRYDAESASFKEPRYFSFQQVFLRQQASQERLDELEAAIEDGLAPSDVRAASDIFLAGYQFSRLSERAIAQQFGVAFAGAVVQSEWPLAQWVGPIESVFGQHWLWFDRIIEPRTPELAEVSDQLLRDMMREREDQAVSDWVATVIDGYEVRYQ